MPVKTHIIAFNANQYCNLLAPMFPNVEFTYDLDKGTFSDPTYECEILISFGLFLNAEIFRRNKKLRWVQALGTGTDGIDNQPELAPGALLTSMRGIHPPQMTEMAFLLMLALNRNLPKIIDNQRGHVWQRWPGLILEGKTVRLEPLTLEHAAGVLATGASESIWTFFAVPAPTNLAEAQKWIESRLADHAAGQRLPFAVICLSDG